MKLADWRRDTGRTQQTLADELGVDISTVARWENMTRDPDRAMKQRLFELSDGLVEPNDFYDLPGWRRLLASALAKLARPAA